VIGKSTQTQELRQQETVRSLVSAHLQSYKQDNSKILCKINNSLWWQSTRQGQTEQNAKAKPASIKGLSRQTDTEITQYQQTCREKILKECHKKFSSSGKEINYVLVVLPSKENTGQHVWVLSIRREF
jgi:hypothetical protein